MARRLQILFTVAAAAGIAAGFGLSATASYPARPTLAASASYSGWDTEAFYLEFGPEPQRLSVTLPAAYRIGTQPPPQGFGNADLAVVPLTGGSRTEYNGYLKSVAAAAYAADPDAQKCAPGPHYAAWSFVVQTDSGLSITLPIAIDRRGPNYTVTICFDALHEKNLRATQVDIGDDTDGAVVKAPVRFGRYLFDAIVTPFAANGSPDPSHAYEMRGASNIPFRLNVTDVVYHAKTKTFIATGLVLAANKPVVGDPIDIFGMPSKFDIDIVHLYRIGTARTGPGGKFLFKTTLARAPVWVTIRDPGRVTSMCPGHPTAAAGCVSSSTVGDLTVGYHKVRQARR